jgi:hypothetical protein
VRNRYLYLVDKQKERRATLGGGEAHIAGSVTSSAAAEGGDVSLFDCMTIE